MIVNFLFWNLNKRPLEALVARLVADHDVQILALVECLIDPVTMIAAIEAAGVAGFTYPAGPANYAGDIRVFIRFPRSALKHIYGDTNNHVMIRRASLPGVPDFLLAVAHLQSKLFWSNDDQAMASAIRVSRSIREREEYYGHRRTIVLGDLNMNPFEVGVVASDGLHAVMTRQTARPGLREVDAQHLPFFYNPMWRFFGERVSGPPGTYHYPAHGKPVSYFWNIFDQVLIRPSLMDGLEDVRILDVVGKTSLLDVNGLPDAETGSDHLPLLVRIAL